MEDLLSLINRKRHCAMPFSIQVYTDVIKE
uniref:Uncharacterized protein n=1 Tax=Siphoviridae sp. ctUse40 TaxID=2826356 RepID=A0A8S5NDP6_9CAUD|nr:MAG TPA: hypothetical protein [Siphoviridae sp. ctUse40]